MGVYIKGMEMPKTCHCCSMCVQVSDGDIDWHWECCLLCEKVARYATDRIPGCPLIPAPPHGRLIDKDALEADISASVVFSGRDGNAEIVGAKKIINRLHVAPTIIPVEEGK